MLNVNTDIKLIVQESDHPEEGYGLLIKPVPGQILAQMDVRSEESDAYARLFAAAPDLLAAVEHVLIASEDGGDMEDIDWNLLRSVVSLATS